MSWNLCRRRGGRWLRGVIRGSILRLSSPCNGLSQEMGLDEAVAHERSPPGVLLVGLPIVVKKKNRKKREKMYGLKMKKGG